MNPHLAAFREEIKNRAKLYVYIYREMAKEVGKEKATEILKKAIYARGQEKGLKLANKLGKPDLQTLADDFITGNKDMDAFGHEVVQISQKHVLLRLNQCPLVEAWKEAGLTPEEQKIMCDIAYQIDFGKFNTAGYKLTFNCRIADGGESCDLHVTQRDLSEVPQQEM